MISAGISACAGASACAPGSSCASACSGCVTASQRGSDGVSVVLFVVDDLGFQVVRVFQVGRLLAKVLGVFCASLADGIARLAICNGVGRSGLVDHCSLPIDS